MRLLTQSKQKPNLLLADYQLREERNGLDFIRSARELLGADIPAVLITAVREQALKEEANDMLDYHLNRKTRKTQALLKSFKFD